MRISLPPWSGAEIIRKMGDFKFRTIVNVPEAENKLDYGSRILMLGSCFSTEIGGILQDYRFNVLVNPFGVLYNPCSIANSIERMIGCRPFVLEEVIQTNPTDKSSPARFASFQHHSSFAKSTPEEFLENANNALAQASEFLMQADTIIITLGTAWVFRNNSTGSVVSNCHKRSAKEFTRELLDIDKCKAQLQKIADFLPDKNIIFTVSPIRHLKDTPHGNQISKSTLLLAIEQVLVGRGNCTYFPSYEIMMDDLRDYRFYAEDMLHPSSLAVKYIFDKFKESHISPFAFKQMESNMRLTKAERHIQK